MKVLVDGLLRVPTFTWNSILTLPRLTSRTGHFLKQSSAIYSICAKKAIQRSPKPCRDLGKSFHSSSSLGSTSTKSQSFSPNPRLSFHLAASASGKGRKFQHDRNTYEYDAKAQDALGLQRGETRAQQKANRPDSGQDAFFVAKLQPSSTAFGIADGVGGWATSGVDPAEFSHGFCHYMAKTTLAWTHGRLSPRMLMEIGYQNIIDDPSVRAGGSTACIGIAGPDGSLQMANLGDSGFLQLRLGAVQHYSNPQTHAFNTPYQLSIIPPKIIAQSAIFGGMPLSDLPEQAELSTGELRHGDVLILATDGVWDNLNPQEVLNIVSSQMRSYRAWTETENQGLVVSDDMAELTKAGGLGEKKGRQTIQGVVAAAVAGEAKLASMNDRRDGPFAKEVQKYYPEEGYHGGKVDDICVIALLAVEHSDSASRDSR
jgi:protein phosphatase PTC7